MPDVTSSELSTLLREIRADRDNHIVIDGDKDRPIPDSIAQATAFGREWDELEGNRRDLNGFSGSRLEMDLAVSGKSMHCYSWAHTQDDVEAWRLMVHAMALRAEKGDEPAANLVQLFRASGGFEAFSFAPKWFHYGMQIVEVDDKLAASWCATSISKAVVSDAKLPWPAFVLRVPTILQGFMVNGEPILRISVTKQEILRGQPKIRVTLLTANKFRTLVVGNLALLDDLSEEESLDLMDTVNLERKTVLNADSRLLWAIGRILIGCCLTLTGDPSVVKRFGPTPGLKKPSLGKTPRAGTPPEATLYRFMAPVRVDLRREISDYLNNRTDRKVNVRTLVSGHWKMQPHGPMFVSRKWIHVEPYWRGDADGPLAVRPHRVVDSV